MKTPKNASGKSHKPGKKGRPIFKAKHKQSGGPKTRKDLRKEKRQAKKQRQQQHVLKKFGKVKNKAEEKGIESKPMNKDKTTIKSNKQFSKQSQKTKPKNETQQYSKEGPTQNLKVVKKKLEKEMQVERMKQLQMANKEEDKNIKQLAKQLKMNKRKSKSLPTVFATEGLDCILFVMFVCIIFLIPLINLYVQCKYLCSGKPIRFIHLQ